MRLIDADALELEPDQYNAFAMNGVAFAGRFGGKTAAMVQNALKHMIDNAPTIDAVEVVRCKDCKRRYSSEFCECRPENAFCSDGEARSDHGHWIDYVHACGFYTQGYICSECRTGSFERLAECPKCHAKMNGKEG